MDRQVILTPRAWRDLENIQGYIAQDNPEAAARFCQGLLREALSLKTFPDRGQKTRGDISRSIVYRNYLIFYESDPAQVSILRFWHSARNQERLRLKENAATYSPPFASLQPVPA